MFTATASSRVWWQPSTDADTERASVGGLHQHHAHGQAAAAARRLLRVWVAAATTAARERQGSTGVGRLLQSGHERFTRGGKPTDADTGRAGVRV